MNKQQKFLLIVQCGILTDVKDMHTDVAVDIAMDMMAHAIEAAPKIPELSTAIGAAKVFLEHTSARTSGGNSPDQKPEWLLP